MACMALQAEERLPEDEEVVVYRTVGAVTGPAVLREFRVFIDKGALFFGMALRAGRLYGILPEKPVIDRTVRVMAVSTENPVLRKGVMARHRKLRTYLLMAGETHLPGIPRPHHEVMVSLLEGTAYAVAVDAGDVIDRMYVCVPVMEVEGRIRTVTFQADE